MSKTISIGKNTLGSGGKMESNLQNYDSSTSDKGYTFKTTGAAGTLIPFMSEVALPESEWEINLDADVMTHPTIGPLFDSFKVQLDVFVTPMRLYNGKLHMNMLNIGKKMSDIKIPQVELTAKSGSEEQVEPSSIFSYLDIRGLGRYEDVDSVDEIRKRKFNAIPYINKFQIYNNMKKTIIPDLLGRIQSVEIQEGETIETKVARITQNKEPITDSAPIIFTEKKDGVLPAYNIRTDRFDIALEAMDKIGKSKAKKEINMLII